MKRGLLWLWFWKCKVEESHLVMALLLADPQGGTGNNTAKDGEQVYAYMSLLEPLSLLIKPPGFNFGALLWWLQKSASFSYSAGDQTRDPHTLVSCSTSELPYVMGEQLLGVQAWGRSGRTSREEELLLDMQGLQHCSAGSSTNVVLYTFEISLHLPRYRVNTW